MGKAEWLFPLESDTVRPSATLLVWAAALSWLGPLPARADDTSSPKHAASAPDGTARETKAGKKKRKAASAKKKGVSAKPRVDDSALGEVALEGRILARAAYVRHHEPFLDGASVLRTRPVSSFDSSVRSARLGAHYESPARRVAAEVEGEFAGKPELKDAWVRLRMKPAHAQVGQFKVPFSTLAKTRLLDLPLVERGLVHDLLSDELEIGGRRPGAVVVGRTRFGAVRPSLTLGAFQGSVLVEREGSERKVRALSERTLASQSLVARAEVTWAAFTFGAAFEDRVGTPAVLVSRRYATYAADAALDGFVLGRGVRLWLEGTLGRSWFEHARKPTDDRDALFAAAQLVGAVRFGGREPGALYLEPFGMVSAFDPDTEVGFDLASEQALGVNVGLWKIARLGVAANVTKLERNFPRAYGLGPRPERAAIVLQAAAEF
jgi:hypothetical protein